MANKYRNEPLHERLIIAGNPSPNSTRGRGQARQRARDVRREAVREKVAERYHFSKVKTLTKHHFQAARRKGASISWSEARGRALEQTVAFSGLSLE
jgi:hypothetical protein